VVFPAREWHRLGLPLPVERRPDRLEVPSMPRTAKPYRLVPAEVPKQAGRRGSVYAEIVAEFVASGVESALVEMSGRKANSLNVGLRKAVTTSGVRVKVVRSGQVYLLKA
jgi:hypothetical protein